MTTRWQIYSTKPYRSKPYLAHVRGYPCFSCGGPASDAHHLRHATTGGPSGVASKVSDAMAVPLCRMCHMKVHTWGDEELYWIDRGIDPIVWAREHYAQWSESK